MTKKKEEQPDATPIEAPEVAPKPHEKEHKCISKEEFEDLTNTLKRLQAEFENYKKRTEKENAQFIKNANAGLIRELLAVLDSFELAIKNSNNIENPDVLKFKKGMELIYAQLYSTLESQGLRIINTQNQKFDPYKHEVLMVKECDKEDDLILQEFQKGYMLNDIVIRHSKVMIAKQVKNDGTQQQK